MDGDDGEARLRERTQPSPSLPSRGPPCRRETEQRHRLSSSVESTPAGSVAAAISNATVKLMHEYTGRGPTRARTYIEGDLIAVVLHDTLTMGERSLVRDGEGALVLATRKAFQRSMGPQLTAMVEQLSGRRVLAFLSDNHIEPDVAVETFVLEPAGREAREQN